MTIEAKAEEMIEPVRGAFVATIQTALGTLPPHEALRLANSLCVAWLETLRGHRILHQSRPPLDHEQIQRDWLGGMSPEEIQRKHGCSKVTAYRYHPAKRAA